MKNMLVCLSLIFLIFINSVFVFSYWDSRTDLSQSSNHVFAGNSYETMMQKVTSNPDERLIPYGNIRGVNDVYEVEFTYDVLVLKGYQLDVEVIQVNFIQNSQIYTDTFDLVNVDIHVETVESFDVEDYEVRITVTLSLNRPSCEDGARLLRGSSLKFEIAFNRVNVSN